jgi:integrase
MTTKKTKRSNGGGTISWHKWSNSYEVKIMHDNKRTRSRYAKTFRQAQDKLREMQSQLYSKPSSVLDSSMLLRDFLINSFLIDKGATTNTATGARWKDKTLRDYTIIVNKHLIPRLGHLQLRNITSREILQAWQKMNTIRKYKSGHVIQSCQRRLSSALNLAVHLGLIDSNPSHYIQWITPIVKDTGVLLDEQKDRVFEWLADKQNIFNPYYEYFYLLLDTGARRNELLGLQWINIDFKLFRINIEHQLKVVPNSASKLEFETPMTNAGKRTIRITQDNKELLEEYLKKQSVWRTQRDGHKERLLPRPKDLVFRRPTEKVGELGSVLLPDSVTHAWLKITRRMNDIFDNERRCGISDIPPIKARLHDLRHTHATLLLGSGADKLDVSRRLGHRKVQTTENIYSEITPTREQDTIIKYEQRIRRHDGNYNN